eukprot:evm.model.scf_347.8 EVM.evm.TU.scf_347.8   scf_347:59109-64672(+)
MTEDLRPAATVVTDHPADQPRTRRQHPGDRRPRRPPTSPEGLALLASWVEDPSHLAAGLTRGGARDPEVLNRVATISKLLAGQEGREEGLAIGGRPRNGLRASASAGDVRAGLPEAGTPGGSARRRAAWSHHGAVEWPNNSGGHLRHPGVEKLLVEYYKMMDAARAGPTGRAAAPASSWNMLLVQWLCPQPPECLELQSVVQVCRSNAGVGAMVIMYMLPVLVPLWLYLLRHLMGRSWLGCLLFAILGLVLLKAAESLNKERMSKQKQGLEGKVLAFKIPANGKMPPESKELLTVVDKCRSAGQSRAQLVAHRGSRGGTRDLSMPGSSPPGNVDVSSHGGDPAIHALLEDINVVRRALGVDRGSDMAVSADIAELGRQVKMLCEAVGVPHDGRNLSSVDALSEKLQEVKGVVGC